MIEPAWRGETCFILAGGPSAAAQPLKLLRERKVIAVNSGYRAFPIAQYLFFGDARWWEEELGKCAACIEIFGELGGRLITCATGISDPRPIKLRRVRPPPLSSDPGAVAMVKTSLAGAINLAVHLGVRAIVLVGADCKPADDGRTHHHAPHPWPQRDDCYANWIAELESIAPDLAARNIVVANASPGSALACWPIMTLEEALL